ncbi:hypothetical protein HYH03_014933 [Edaphochlamys debaryana]|uniref:Major facilitator superfamily (MFS) profile domain-containing protein n=1 Tax=Edaphochlamys debaryana TaxID=47281 RepID=A0A835XN23_9CHLO|nr:hypothetical protein HYH03_014933 [Edaphochlamys debaryana]|eukprot:KAG2486352.1 hypothetical protein HYH03_014933 [Edaphochlamys debaryana]
MGLFASNFITGDGDDGQPLGVKAAFGLSTLQLGALPALYALGMVVSSFLFAALASRFNSFRLIGAGLAAWALGAALTGAAAEYGMLAVARTLTGCGEAPLLTLTFTFVDDVAPPARKTLWFACLGLFPVLGSALGYVLAEPLTQALGWRGAFWLLAGCGLPLAGAALALPPVHLAAVGGGAGGRGRGRAQRGRAAGAQPGPGPGEEAGEQAAYGLLEGGPGAGGAGAGAGAHASPSLLRHRPAPLELVGVGVPGSPGSSGPAPSHTPALSQGQSGQRGRGGGGGGSRGSGGGEGCEGLRTPLTGGMANSSHAPSADLGPSSGAGGRRTPPSAASGPACPPGSSHALTPRPHHSDAGEGGAGAGAGGPPVRGWRCVLRRWRSAAAAGAGALLRHPACCLNNFGYAPVQWVFGLVSFWGPKALKEMYGMSGSGPELVIGAVTVASGLAGTLLGGWLLDAAGSSLRNGFALQAASVALALLFLELAFLAAASYAGFCVLLALGLTAVFASQAPSYALSMWTVPPQYRPLSQAQIILLQHLLGDVPSPPVTGALYGVTGSWRTAMGAACSYLVVGVVLFAAGAALAAAGRARDFREEVEGEEVGGELGEAEGAEGAGAGPGAGDSHELVGGRGGATSV